MFRAVVIRRNFQVTADICVGVSIAHFGTHHAHASFYLVKSFEVKRIKWPTKKGRLHARHENYGERRHYITYLDVKFAVKFARCYLIVVLLVKLVASAGDQK